MSWNGFVETSSRADIRASSAASPLIVMAHEMCLQSKFCGTTTGSAFRRPLGFGMIPGSYVLQSSWYSGYLVRHDVPALSELTADLLDKHYCAHVELRTFFAEPLATRAA
jgi:hypothetical protein